MWLMRGLKFTALGLRFNLQNPNEELSASFTKGYEQSLKKYHTILIRPVFYVSLPFLSGAQRCHSNPMIMTALVWCT